MAAVKPPESVGGERYINIKFPVDKRGKKTFVTRKKLFLRSWTVQAVISQQKKDSSSPIIQVTLFVKDGKSVILTLKSQSNNLFEL